MTDLATPETITSFYLYGQAEKPASIEDRLRNLEKSATFSLAVDHTRYMASIGVYARPAKSAFVSDFFSGNLDRSFGVTDEQGVTRISIADYLAVSGKSRSSLQIDLYHYFNGVGSDDYDARAYVWGTSSYIVNQNATLIWGTDGEYSISGLEVGVNRNIKPNDNFDFESSNAFIDVINKTILQPNIDPYGIGRRIDFTFDSGHGNQFASYSSSDYAHDVAAAIVDYSPDYPGFAAAAGRLISELVGSGVVEYTTEDNQWIIYGTREADELSAADYFAQPDGLTEFPEHGIAVAAGAGDDKVTGTDLNDLIYGMDGDDVIYGLGGNDRLSGGLGNDHLIAGDQGSLLDGGAGNDILVGGAGEDNIIGGDGDDTITAGAGDIIYGGAGADTFFLSSDATRGQGGSIVRIMDLDESDRIYVDGFLIKGGSLVLRGVTGPDGEWEQKVDRLELSWAKEDPSLAPFFGEYYDIRNGHGNIFLDGTNKAGNEGFLQIAFDYTGSPPAGIIYSYSEIGDPMPIPM